MSVIVTNVTNPQVVAGPGSAVSSTQITRFTEAMRVYYASRGAQILSLPIMSKQMGAAPGENSITEPIRGARTGRRTVKAVGDQPVELGFGTFARQFTYDASEQGMINYDYEQVGDARYNTMTEDGRIVVDEHIDTMATRMMHMLYKTALLSGVANYLNGPATVLKTGITSGLIANAYANTGAGATALYRDLLILKRTMKDRPHNRAGRYMWLMRHDLWDTFKNPDGPVASKDFNTGAGDITDGWNGERWDGDPVALLPDEYWPSTNYVDHSFSRYNVDARGTVNNGRPLAFYVAIGSERESPLSLILPPSGVTTGASLDIQIEDDNIRRVHTMSFRSRYAIESYDPGAVGCLRITSQTP